MIGLPQRKRPRNRTPDNDAYFWYVTGVLVTIGAVVGFVIPFVDRVASVMAANLHWMGAAFGMMAGVALAAIAEWLWLTVGRGAKWVWFRLGFGPLPEAVPNLATPTSPLVDNTTLGNSIGARLDQALVGAQRLDICTSYVSKAGLERLANWLDQMDKDARARLLIGMKPNGWQDWGQGALTNKAAPHFLALHFGYDRAAVPVLDRLARLQATGRLEVRLRYPRAALHAKLYVWTDADGRPANLIGSSNLTGPGLGSQGELNAHMQKMAGIRYFVAWFDARWQEKASVGDPKLLEYTKQAVMTPRNQGAA